MKLYLDVLYSAQDLDIASESAIRLSDHQMDAGKTERGKRVFTQSAECKCAIFYSKIKRQVTKLAKRLYEHRLYDVAAKITDLLLENTPKKSR